MLQRILWALLFLAFPLASPSLAQTWLTVGAGSFFEDSELKGERRVSVQTTDQSFEYVSEGGLNASLGVMRHYSPTIRYGLQYTYYGNYTALRTVDGEVPDDPDRFQFGRLMDLQLAFDWAVPLMTNLDLVLGGSAGSGFLFPGGDFMDEIEREQDAGASVVSWPRVGVIVGPSVGARWKYSPHLMIKAGTTATWNKLFLFWTTETVDGTAFSRKWSTSTVRYELSLGIEVKL